MKNASMSTTSTLSEGISDLNNDGKYNGMIKMGRLKRLKLVLYSLFTFLQMVVPQLWPMHYIVSLLRIAQLAGASIPVANPFIYQDGTLIKETISVISCSYNYFPKGSFLQFSEYLLFGYSCLILLFIIILIHSSNSLVEKGKLTSGISIFISVFMQTIGYIMHPPVFSLIGESIVAIVNKKLPDKTFILSVSIICSIIMYMIYFSLFSRIFMVSLQFNPDSLQTVQGSFSSSLVLYTSLLSLLLSIKDNTDSRLGYIPLFFSMIIYYQLFKKLILGSTIINENHNTHVLASSFFGAFLTLIVVAIEMSQQKIGDSFVFLLILLYFLCFLLSAKILKRINTSHLVKLDCIESDSSIIPSTITEKSMINTIVSGFVFSHPLCNSLKVFNILMQYHSDSIELLTTYAKYVAIYPEESKTLDWIKKQIDNSLDKGSSSKLISIQIKSLIQRRESNLTQTLRKKLNEISKTVASTKNKVRNLWDIILQGNISEMESVLNRAYKAVENNQREYNHLLIQYPNNCYVTRSYAAFLREILADQNGYLEWLDKSKQLKRGRAIMADVTFELGLHAFPHLPSSVRMVQEVFSSNDIESVNQEIEIEESIESAQTRFNKYLSQRISTIRMPSVRIAVILSICLVVLIVFLPILYLLYNLNPFIDEILNPLDFMMSISYIRSLCYQFSCLGTRWAMEKLPEIGTNDTLFHDIDYGSYLPKSFGEYTKTKDQVNYLARIAPIIAQKSNEYRSYKTGDHVFDQIRKLCFSQTIDFQFFQNISTFKWVKMSIQDIIMDAVLQITTFISAETVNETYLNNPGLLNPRNNIIVSGTATSQALDLLAKYLEETDLNLQIIFTQYQQYYIVISVFVFFLVMFIAINRINREKMTIYKCLTSLPKGIVGSIIESMRVVHKEGIDGTKTSDSYSEISKQEESIIKVFNSASEINSGSSNQFFFFFLISLMLGLSIWSFYTICGLYKSESQIMTQVAPHIDYLLGISGYIYGIFSTLYSMILPMSGYKILSPDPFYILARMAPRQVAYNKYYHNLRFGEETSNRLPYVGIKDGIEHASKLTFCKDSSGIPNSIMEFFSCNDPDTNLLLLEMLIFRIIHPYSVLRTNISTKEDLVNEAWFLGSILLYDTYLFPMFEFVIDRLTNQLVNTLGPKMLPIGFALVMILLIEIVIIVQIRRNQSILTYCLSLLIHCPSTTISSNKRIMSILSGDFSHSYEDMTLRNQEFYSTLVDNLPDSVLSFDTEGNIQIMNNSCCTHFSVKRDQYIGKNISSFITQDRFRMNFEEFKRKSSSIEGCNTEIQIAEDKLIVHCNMYTFNEMSFIFMGDTTQSTNYYKLIADEKAKSDMLLSSILPSILVPRVLANEKNIAFSVQSATVVFIDIVGFTPWCSSNSVTKVMNVLNTIFRDFDSMLATHPTMTKIKCIGDCYMAAGGIFSESTQPSKHSKDVVDFGIEAINAIKSINERLGENIQIRVGINTGGPIVAGVLGVSKPTFEILGPTINTSQQMEHTGVPMQIHISRSVYELIYGGNYKIKERGQTAIKGGSVLTYLVLPE